MPYVAAEKVRVRTVECRTVFQLKPFRIGKKLSCFVVLWTVEGGGGQSTAYVFNRRPYLGAKSLFLYLKMWMMALSPFT